MKIKIIFALFITTVVLVLIIGGVTTAWFTDEVSPSSTAGMVTGEMDFTVTPIEPDPDEDHEWEIGDEDDKCRDFAWTIENTGSKSSFYRARLVEEFTGESQTAWARGAKFSDHGFKGGGWGMFFEYDENDWYGSVEEPLIAGQHYPAGTVEVSYDDNNNKIIVDVETNENWELGKIDLVIAESIDLFRDEIDPPAPGQFPFKVEFDENVSSYTFEVPRGDGDIVGTIEQKDPFIVAVHADVDCTGKPSVNWSLNEDCDYSWRESEVAEDDWDWYYCENSVAPEQLVQLCLEGCLDPEQLALPGDYDVKIEVEAVQASHDAIDEKWPHHPCND